MASHSSTAGLWLIPVCAVALAACGDSGGFSGRLQITFSDGASGDVKIPLRCTGDPQTTLTGMDAYALASDIPGVKIVGVPRGVELLSIHLAPAPPAVAGATELHIPIEMTLVEKGFDAIGKRTTLLTGFTPVQLGVAGVPLGWGAGVAGGALHFRVDTTGSC